MWPERSTLGRDAEAIAHLRRAIALKADYQDALLNRANVQPSADFFAEPHVDSLIGYAKVFHAAGIRWTS